MTDEPADLHMQIDRIFTHARHAAERQKAERRDAASRRKDAFKARVAAEALKVAEVLAPLMARGDRQGHAFLSFGEEEKFYRAVAECLRPHDVAVSKVLLATEGATLAGLKAANEWDGTVLPYSHFAHFGPATAIIEHRQAYDPRDDGEVVKTY